VLELGCGSGRLLATVAARLRRGFAAGIDPSALMVRHARMRNRRWIAQGRAEVSAGRSDDLGRFADARFDKVYGTHVVYFWMEPKRDLAEIRRVLRPGGSLVLGFFPSEDGTAGATRPLGARCASSAGRASPT
jgi:SAM-dependent methyltransferase